MGNHLDITEFKALMKREVDNFLIPSRNDSSCFLIWYLINYFKIDEDIAPDFVCDSINDKGIDGIFIDETTNEIFIFQSKYSPNPGNDQGENDLKNFKGASTWFDDHSNFDKLDKSIASNQLKSLVKRLKIYDYIEKGFLVSNIFVTNKIFDQGAKEFLSIAGKNFEGIDLNYLGENYLYNGKEEFVEDSFQFSYDKDNSITGRIDNHAYYIFPAKVKEIVKLDGIQDKTLFSKNVRYGLGRTRVNRDIKTTIQKNREHENVVLYHNGITIICEEIKEKDKELEISNYSIVNGCQSTITFYENRNNLSDELFVLLKIIKTLSTDDLGKKVTYFTNNQNSISLRDLKSNDKKQQNIQTMFKELHSNNIISSKILYKIKQGEDQSGFDEVISNDFVSQMITAFILKEPQTTHQKTKIFTDNYNNIFNRNIDASIIFLLLTFYNSIGSNIEEIKHDGVQSYKTTRFFILYVIRLILEEDEIGKFLISEPSNFLIKYKNNLQTKFDKFLKNIIIDFDYLINDKVKGKEENKDYFDFKNDLRNKIEIEKMGNQLVVDYRKQVNKDEESSFNFIINN